MAKPKKNKAKNKAEQDTCSCPILINEDWDENELDWNGKQFFRVSFKNWLYRPKQDTSKDIIEGYKEIARRGYGAIPDGLVLFKNGMFRGEYFIEIKKGDQNDMDVKTFRNYVHSKIYFGAYEDLSKVAKTFDFDPLNIYYVHFSCPVCTPDSDQQKTVLIGEKRIY